MKNELLVTMAMEYDNGGGVTFWHIVSVSLRTGIFYYDLKCADRRGSTGLRTIHSEVFTRGRARQFAAQIKPLPYKQLRPPTPEEISGFRSLYGAYVG